MKTLNIATALLLSSVNSASCPFGFLHQTIGVGPSAESTGLIEMDIDILSTDKGIKKEQLNNVGASLMNLLAEDDDSLIQEEDYIEKKLHDFFNIQLYSNIYVGSEKKPFKMIFDTGSSWVWVQHKICKKCLHNPDKFDSLESTTFKQNTTDLSILRYGRGTVYGFNIDEQVCLNKESAQGNGCMVDYRMKTIVAQEDLQGLASSGIIGLSPAQESGAQLFVPSLYEQKAIPRSMFSMYIETKQQSKIQLGGYNLKKYALPGAKMNFHKLSTDHYWQVPLSENKIKMGDFEFEPSTMQMMADSGTSLNMIPDEDLEIIYGHFFKGKFEGCHKLHNSLYMCDCSVEQFQSLPDLTFKIDDVQYTIPRNGWVERTDEGQCVIKFMHAPNRPYWILGLNFFQNYYTVFDYENNAIGFAPSINMGQPSSKSFLNWLVDSEKAISQQKMKQSGMQKIVQVHIDAIKEVSFYSQELILIASVVGLVWIFTIYYFCLVKKSKQVTHVEQSLQGKQKREVDEIKQNQLDQL